MASEYEVSIIIPTFRASRDLLDCLESIRDDDDSPIHEVIVAFNTGIPDDMDLTASHPKARAVVAEKNLGFAAACNLGAQNAIGETLVFINDDMTVSPGWLRNLTMPINHENFYVTGGRILSQDGKKIDFDGSSINLLGWGFQHGYGEPVQSVSSGDEFSTQRKIPFACGGNLAIRAEIFRKAGRFDEDYFAWYEDVDLGWRLSLMGHETVYAPDAVVHHAGGSTGSLMPVAVKWFLQERNTLQTIIKNYSDAILTKILPLAFGLVAVRAEILSGLGASDVLVDNYWRETILGKDRPSSVADGAGGFVRGLVDGVKESLKAGMKNARKSSLPESYLPLENRGAAGLLALEWCLNNWDRLKEKRGKVQESRVKKDGEVLPLFDDPLRPVLGHPREVEAMKPLESVLHDLMSE